MYIQITWTSKCFAETYGCFLPRTEAIISYLPLSHIAAQVHVGPAHLSVNTDLLHIPSLCLHLQMLDLYLQIHIGGTTYFAQPDALKVHPNAFG